MKCLCMRHIPYAVNQCVTFLPRVQGPTFVLEQLSVNLHQNREWYIYCIFKATAHNELLIIWVFFYMMLMMDFWNLATDVPFTNMDWQ